MGIYTIDFKVTVEAESDPDANMLGREITDMLLDVDGVKDAENFYPEVVYE